VYAVTHGELGIGSFEKGKAQSRLTLLPLFLMEGDDSAENLRIRAAGIAKSYNMLKRKGYITVTIDGHEIVPLHANYLDQSSRQTRLEAHDDLDEQYLTIDERGDSSPSQDRVVVYTGVVSLAGGHASVEIIGQQEARFGTTAGIHGRE